MLARALLAASLLLPGTALAAAPYASPDTLKEGIPYVLDTSSLGMYARITDPQGSTFKNIGAYELRTRANLGRKLTYCLGLDGEIGGSSKGMVYGVTGYLAGLGVRWGDANTFSVCGGVGYDGVRYAVPHAIRFPVEAALSTQLGPIRPTLYLRPSWLAGGGRADMIGGPTGFGKELEAGLLVRLARQHHYWTTASGGGGLAIGVAYREFLNTRYVGVLLGVNIVGAQ